MSELISDPYARAAAERGVELPPEDAERAAAEEAGYEWYADPDDDYDPDDPGEEPSWAIWGGHAPPASPVP